MCHSTLRAYPVLPALSQRNRSSAAIPESGVRCLRITHPFATNLPLDYSIGSFVRLACLNHAVSVRSEPGSNSSIFIVCLCGAKTTQEGIRKRLYTHVCSRECRMSGRSQTKHTKNRESCTLFPVSFNPPLNSQQAELTFSLRYNCLLVKEQPKLVSQFRNSLSYQRKLYPASRNIIFSKRFSPNTAVSY